MVPSIPWGSSQGQGTKLFFHSLPLSEGTQISCWSFSKVHFSPQSALEEAYSSVSAVAGTAGATAWHRGQSLRAGECGTVGSHGG